MMAPDKVMFSSGVMSPAWVDGDDFLIPAFSYPMNNNPIPSMSNERSSSSAHNTGSPSSTESFIASATASPTSHLQHSAPAEQTFRKSTTWPRQRAEAAQVLQARSASVPLASVLGDFDRLQATGYAAVDLPPVPEMSGGDLLDQQELGRRTGHTNALDLSKAMPAMGSLDSQNWLNILMDPMAPNSQLPLANGNAGLDMVTSAALPQFTLENIEGAYPPQSGYSNQGNMYANGSGALPTGPLLPAASHKHAADHSLEDLLRTVVGDVTSGQGHGRRKSNTAGFTEPATGAHRGQQDKVQAALRGPFGLDNSELNSGLDIDIAALAETSDFGLSAAAEALIRDPSAAALLGLPDGETSPTGPRHFEDLSSGEDEGDAAKKKGGPRGPGNSKADGKLVSKEEKTQRRLAQNREAARKWRQKKKAYVQELEVAKLKLQLTEQKLKEAEKKAEKCELVKAESGPKSPDEPPPLVSACVAVEDWKGMCEAQREFRLKIEEWKKMIFEKMALLEEAVAKGVPDRQLAPFMEHYRGLVFKKIAMMAEARKVDMFQVLDGTWMTPLERQFMWCGHFRPSIMIKICLQNNETLASEVKKALEELQQQMRLAERSIKCRLEELRDSLVGELLASMKLHVTDSESGHSLLPASLVGFDELVQEVDDTFVKFFFKLHTQLLTPTQSARTIVAIGDFIKNMQELSKLLIGSSIPNADVKMEDLPAEESHEAALRAIVSAS